MAALAPTMASPDALCLKRTYDEAGLGDAVHDDQAALTMVEELSPGEELTDPSAKLSLPSSIAEHSRPKSPLPQDTSIIAGSLPMLPTLGTNTVSSTTKKLKLTAAEKDAKKLEKEVRDRQRAEEKAKKDEEKRIRDAEKEERRMVKEEQLKLKEEERKLKEDEKRRKEEERRLKEEEKEKKAKSQLRLNSFFVQPPIPADVSTGSPKRTCPSPQGSRRSSITSLDGVRAISRGRSTSATPQKSQLPEYERLFLPFWVQPCTTLAPYNRFSRDDEGVKYAQDKIDDSLNSGNKVPKKDDNTFNPYELLHISSRQYMRHERPRYTVKDIMARMQGSAQSPIDLTDAKANGVVKPARMLALIPTKYLRFAEDVRPPYVGTFTKFPSGCDIGKLCKNPFTRAIPQTDYDYDSEAEWEEPGEGEDLDSDGEEEVNEDDEDDDMKEFLDDEDGGDGIRTLNQKRRLITVDLEPSSTGLCWEGGYEANRRAPAPDEGLVDLRTYRFEVILDRLQLPIDPYSTAYWHPQSEFRSIDTSLPQSLKISMDPPRIPLHTLNRTNLLFPNTALPANSPKARGPSEDNSAAAKPPKPPKRLIPPEVMDDFKTAVQGNDLTKAGLVEILKKQFPKQSKDAIKDTLGLVAERVGVKEADKRWTIKAEYQH